MVLFGIKHNRAYENARLCSGTLLMCPELSGTRNSEETNQKKRLIDAAVHKRNQSLENFMNLLRIH